MRIVFCGETAVQRAPRPIQMLVLFLCLCASLLPGLGQRALAAQTPPVPFRLGLFAAGTASWEVDAMIRLQSLDPQKVALEVTRLASPQAGKIALLGGSVDAIIADWLWAARARADGDRVIFIPYSAAVGALVAAPNSAIASLSDLNGKRIGIAGGPLDKNWLIFQAAALEQGVELKQQSTLSFGAPPLLSAQLEQGQLDAVLTFWHFAARLNAQGYPTVRTIEQMTADLLRQPPTPLPWLGYVVRQDWAESHPQALQAFYNAALTARHALENDPALWTSVALADQATPPALVAALRAGWQAGLPHPWGEAQQERASTVFDLLRTLGGEATTGSADHLDRSLFWPLTLTATGDVQWPTPRAY